jgi:hypothetical protein
LRFKILCRDITEGVHFLNSKIISMTFYMKKNCVITSLSIIYLFLCCTKGHAQAMDRIVRKDSTEWHVMVISTEDDSITYRLYGQPKDSVYAIAKSAVQKIIRRDGGRTYYPKPVVYNADGTEKLSKSARIYVDAAAGFWLNDRIYGLADLNIGYRFSEKQAIGLSGIAMSDYSIEASGVGVQYRFTPQRKSLFKLELGYITSASSIDRSGPEIYTHLPQNSSNIYFRLGAAVRFSIFTLGINYVGAGPIMFQINNGQNVPTGRSWSGNMGFLCPQLGIALPKIRKKGKR